jgi:hypothetical protein
MGRLAVLLVLAVSWMAPTAARSSVLVDFPSKPEASITAQMVAPSKCRSIPCRGCANKACSLHGTPCSVSCAAASNAVLPLSDVLATITSIATGPCLFAALRNYQSAPDPHPPRPTFIS